METRREKDNMDKFEEKEMMKMRPFFLKKKHAVGLVINHIPEPVKNVAWCSRHNYESF